MKIMFNASNEELFYEMLCNDSFSGVLGIFECKFLKNLDDPNFRNKRPKHR